MRKLLLTFIALLCSWALSGGNCVDVSSPDRKINISFRCRGGELQYSLRYGKKEIVAFSPVALETEAGIFGKEVRMGKASYSEGTEEYELVVGKTSRVSSKWREALVPLSDSGVKGLDISLQIRVFDDAAAYRFIFNGNKSCRRYYTHRQRKDGPQSCRKPHCDYDVLRQFRQHPRSPIRPPQHRCTR